MRFRFKYRLPVLYINPIHRDILLMMTLGLLAAMAVADVMAMFASRL